MPTLGLARKSSRACASNAASERGSFSAPAAAAATHNAPTTTIRERSIFMLLGTNDGGSLPHAPQTVHDHVLKALHHARAAQAHLSRHRLALKRRRAGRVHLTAHPTGRRAAHHPVASP